MHRDVLLPDDVRVTLHLEAVRRFGNGAVFLQYRTLEDELSG